MRGCIPWEEISHLLETIFLYVAQQEYQDKDKLLYVIQYSRSHLSLECAYRWKLSYHAEYW